jgi:hypothetical protein
VQLSFLYVYITTSYTNPLHLSYTYFGRKKCNILFLCTCSISDSTGTDFCSVINIMFHYAHPIKELFILFILMLDAPQHTYFTPMLMPEYLHCLHNAETIWNSKKAQSSPLCCCPRTVWKFDKLIIQRTKGSDFERRQIQRT